MALKGIASSGFVQLGVSLYPSDPTWEEKKASHPAHSLWLFSVHSCETLGVPSEGKREMALMGSVRS